MLADAVVNNAVWCDAVCRAAGGDTQWLPGVWRNRGASPPFYPDAVTLDAAVRFDPPAAGAVKDSFGCLDLAPFGYAPLFDAQWIGRRPDAARPAPSPLRWSRVADDGALAEWEAAWWRSTRTSAGSTRLYPPTLLHEPGIAFLAGRAASRLAAGCSVTRSGGVAGLGCVFFDGVDAAVALPGLLAAVAALHPGVPVVGYESGADLQRALGCGFQTLGLLRVWLNDGETST